MPARIDLDGSEWPPEIIRRIYNAEYLLRLGQRFKFDANDPNIVSRINRMGSTYIAMRRREDPADMRALNKRYRKLARDIESFRQALIGSADLDLPQMAHSAAIKLNQLPRKTAFPGLTPQESEYEDEAYFREFVQMLEALAYAVEEDKRRSAPKPGPRVNWGLEVIARQAAQFFVVELQGRPFTIDPHKPFKATAAFDFVKALVSPLDDVTDDEIVTAIRNAKSPKKTPNKKSKS
jgi:hypothetical protein